MIVPLTITYILNIIDYIFTAHWVRKFGVDIEANPIGRWMFKNNVAWVYKIFVVGGLLVALGYLIKKAPKTAWMAFIPLVVYATIVLYHIIICCSIKI